MTFSDNLQKASSIRSAFVRLSPARRINDDLVEGATDYFTMSFNGNPFNIIWNEGEFETVFTEDTTLATNDTWYYDRPNLTLHVRTDKSVEGSSQYLSMYHYLTYTNEQENVYPVGITTGDDVVWKDRLKSPPKISASILNMVDSVVSTSASSITLENSDQSLNQWFGTSDSYNSREVEVWFKVDDVFQKMFSGTIRTVDFTGTTISVGVVDKSTLFDNPCYMGNTADEATYNQTTYTVASRDVGKINPFIVGASTYGTVQSSQNPFRLEKSSQELQTFALDTTQLPEAICTSYSGTESGTLNRTWDACRTHQFLSDSVNWGTKLSVQHLGTTANGSLSYNGNGIPQIKVKCTGTHEVQVGDTGFGNYTETSPQSRSGNVRYVVIRVIDNTQYICAILDTGITNWTNTNPEDEFTNPGSGFTYTLPTLAVAFSVLAKMTDDRILTLVPGLDFTITNINLANGTRRVRINLIDDLLLSTQQAHASIYSAISGDNTKLFFRYRASTETLHGTLVEQALKDTGLTVNASSITAANSSLTDGFTNGDCTMTVPPTGSTEHQTVRKVLSEILQSSIGYVRTDNDAEVYYELFDSGTPSSTRDDDDVLSSSLVPRVSYYDMFAKVTVDNTHVGDEDPLHPTTYELNEAQILHKATREKTLKTVFDRVPTGMAARYETFFGKPRVTYRWETSTLDLDTVLGQTITLETTNLLGEVESVDVLVVKITKSLERTSVTGLQVV